MTNTTNGPADHVRLGAISAAIWANDTEKGRRYSVTVERLYRDPETGSWKSTTSFNRDDLLKLGKVSDLANTRIHQMQGLDREQEREASAEPAEPQASSGAAQAGQRATAKARA